MPNHVHRRQLHSWRLGSYLLILAAIAHAQGVPESELPPRRVSEVCDPCDVPTAGPQPLPYGSDLLQSGFGANGAAYTASGTTTEFSAGVFGVAAGYSNTTLASFRGLQLSAIGGGSSGLDGQLALDYSAGLIKRLGADHGLVARAGVDAYLFGNFAFYRSGIELPSLSFGYQRFTRRYLVEMAGRGAFTLVGRYSTQTTGRQHTGTAPTLGGHLAVHLPRVSYEGRYRQLLGTAASGSREVNGLLCGVLRPFSLCTEHRILWSSAGSAFAGYVGVSVLRSIRQVR